MAIQGVVGRVAGITAKVQGSGNVRVKQVQIGASADISAKSINELSDVNAAENDNGLLQYNASNDKWETTTTIDGGTF
jgi:hypothetical protein